jgi:hypothetical protein
VHQDDLAFTARPLICYNFRWRLTRQSSEVISYGNTGFMALLSELVKIVAEVEGLDEVSVGIFARQAREAGHIKQGGRGRSAAKMDVQDAANLLIAVNACALAKEVPEAVPLYRSMQTARRDYSDKEKKLLSEIGLFQTESTLGRDLERIIDLYGNPEQRQIFAERGTGAVFVEFVRPAPTASISIHIWDKGGKGLAITNTYYVTMPSTAGAGDRQDQTMFTSRTLIAVAEALRS